VDFDWVKDFALRLAVSLASSGIIWLAGHFWKGLTRRPRLRITAIVLMPILVFFGWWFIHPLDAPGSWEWIDATAQDKLPRYPDPFRAEILGLADPLTSDDRAALQKKRQASHYKELDRVTAQSPVYKSKEFPKHLAVRSGIEVELIAYVLYKAGDTWAMLGKNNTPSQSIDLDAQPVPNGECRLIVMVFPTTENGYGILRDNVKAKKVDLLDISP
jgi:hypothetical protein